MLTYKIENVSHTKPFESQSLSLQVNGNLVVLAPKAFTYSDNISVEMRLLQSKGLIHIQETRYTPKPVKVKKNNDTDIKQKTLPKEESVSKEEPKSKPTRKRSTNNSTDNGKNEKK